MTALTGKELSEIMNDDIYFATPSSVIKWLNTFDINASQRLIVERMIGFALQRPTRTLNSLRIRLSTSLISEFTSIKERTVITSLQKLVEKGLITKDGNNQNGTLYTVNLSSEIKGLVKRRFKKEAIETKAIPKESNNLPRQDVDANKGSSIQSLEYSLIQKLEDTRAKIESLRPTLPEGFSPAMLLNQKITFSEDNTDEIEKLKKIEQKLILQINSLKIKPKNEVERVIKTLHSKETNSPFRFIRHTDSKALKTRIHKLGIFKSEVERTKYFKEILWAIRFGWYRNFKGSTYHCINHALKLIKDNAWRTPAGFQENQIDGLVLYHGIAS